MPETEPEYGEYLNKPPTDLQERFPDWLIDKVGCDPSGAKSKDAAFREGVRLAVALRMEFQASPENRAATEERRKARVAELETARTEREQARAARSTEREQAAAAKPAAAPQQAKASTPQPAAEAVPVRRGRRARATSAAGTSEAPF